MVYLIKKVLKAEPFKLHLQFNTGEQKTIDLYAKLLEWSNSDDSKFRELLNPQYFSSVKLDPELETIYWDNGVDFCPDTLYRWA